MTPDEEAKLRQEYVFCGYCGSLMQEIIYPRPEFNRRTGKQGKVGSLYWMCPKHGIGLDGYHGEWSQYGYERNPHDSKYLREVSADSKRLID